MRDAREYFRLQVPYTIPGMDQVVIEKELIYKTVKGEPLRADVYRPPGMGSSPLPAVIFVHGDASPELLRDIKDSGQYVSWGRLIAASGLVAVNFNHRSSRQRAALEEPASDVEDLIDFVLGRAGELGIDTSRLAIWTCSAGPPFILPYLCRYAPEFVHAVVIFYGLLDLRHLRPDIADSVPDEVLQRFSPAHQLQNTTNPMPSMLVVRAGQDRPAFNQSIDSFVRVALARNFPIEVINFPDGGHGFDVQVDTEDSKHIIRRTLEFLRDAFDMAEARHLSVP